MAKNMNAVNGEAVTTASPAAEKVRPAKVVKKKELSPTMYVPCISNVKYGQLVYSSSRTPGYIVRWNKYLDEQMIELSELNVMKLSAIGFFQNNWIVIPDSFELKDEVMEFLGIKHFYENMVDPQTINNLLNAPINEAVLEISSMQPSAKAHVIEMAKEAIANGTLDSLRRINALEEALGCKLT